MERILEIRDGCTTLSQLLRSLALAHYLKIYKEVLICSLEKSVTKNLDYLWAGLCLIGAVFFMFRSKLMA